jgi:rubrerythrin
MSTFDDLKTAFAGESQASRKYLAYSKKADKDGFPQVAKLFRAAAEAETVHAQSHLRAMKGVNSTAENLQDAIAGEAYEFQEMYPPFLKDAEQEKLQKAINTFRYALEVEKIHHGLYSEALAAVEAGRDVDGAPIYVCRTCGHTHVGEPPEKCPVCKAGKDKYFEVQ